MGFGKSKQAGEQLTLENEAWELDSVFECVEIVFFGSPGGSFVYQHSDAHADSFFLSFF